MSLGGADKKVLQGDESRSGDSSSLPGKKIMNSHDTKTAQKKPRERMQMNMQPKAPPTQRKQSQGVKKFVGRRKLWGTERVTTEEEVKAFFVS